MQLQLALSKVHKTMTVLNYILAITLTKTLVSANPGITFPSTNDTYFTPYRNEPSTALGLKIGSDLFSNVHNFIISPFNIYNCLGLVQLAANGDTKLELVNLIGEVKKGSLRKDLNDVHSAIRVFLDSSIKIKNDYAIAINYSLENVNFSDPLASRDIINKWVNLETKGTIPEIIGDALDSETKAVLISAIHFKSEWLHPFNSIKSRKFEISETESIELPYMSAFASFPIYRGVTFDALALPYKTNDFKFYVLLPHMHGERAVKNLLKFLTIDQIRDIILHSNEESIIVTMPKFEIKQTLSLNPILKKNQVNKIFDPIWADFKNLYEGESNPKLFVSDILHSAFLQIDEKGTVAGAATATIVSKSGHTVFRVTRPFIFILANSNGLTLFLGAFTNPLAN